MANSTEKNDVASRPYLERQLIVVSKKEIISAAEEEGKNEADAGRPQGIDWAKIGRLALRLASPLGPSSALIDIGVEALRAWNRARESGAPLLLISQEQASGLSFPPGHPREGVVYVGHPALANVYTTMSDFHRVMFEHKFSEAVNLLMSLGATNIRVEHVSGWSRDFSSRLSVPLSEPTSEISGSAGRSSKDASTLLFQATLEGNNDPQIPEQLVWFHREPTWITIAHGRQKFGLKEFSLSVSYLDDFGINAGLKATVAKAGLDVGGKFEGHESTVWRLNGNFGSSGAQAQKKVDDGSSQNANLEVPPKTTRQRAKRP